MDENLFRIVVTVAVSIASLAFVVQAGIMLALYKVARKTQGNAEQLMRKVEPVLAKTGPAMVRAESLMARVEVVLEKTGPVIDRVGPVLDQAVPLIKRVGPVVDEARAVVAKAGSFMERATDVAVSTNMLVQDTRPQVKQISVEAMEIARLGREQVEHIGDLIQDAGQKARARLDQIDHSVDNTIEQVEHVSGAVKRVVMKPVKEASGVAAGISAAVSTLVRGQRQSRVDSATQDEEMFI
jgi:hypothetical protein